MLGVETYNVCRGTPDARHTIMRELVLRGRERMPMRVVARTSGGSRAPSAARRLRDATCDQRGRGRTPVDREEPSAEDTNPGRRERERATRGTALPLECETPNCEYRTN